MVSEKITNQKTWKKSFGQRFGLFLFSYSWGLFDLSTSAFTDDKSNLHYFKLSPVFFPRARLVGGILFLPFRFFYRRSVRILTFTYNTYSMWKDFRPNIYRNGGKFILDFNFFFSIWYLFPLLYSYIRFRPHPIYLLRGCSLLTCLCLSWGSSRLCTRFF